MNQRRVFTFGYAGAPFRAFLHIVDQLDATVLDCRFSPRSRIPTWSGVNLRRALGDCYVWAQPWGNPGYKGTEAALADADAGLAIFDALDSPTVIVMCACKNPQTCHRALVRDLLLRERGIVATELDVLDEPEARQLTIFSKGE